MPLRILVVEDHAPFRQLICAALQRRGEFEITEAADGLEAVQKAEKLQPDLILLDIHLPKLNGFEVARKTCQSCPSARLLFMSQESSPEIVRKALSLGGLGYIQKLSVGTDLLPGIDAVLAGQRFLSRSVALTPATDADAPRRHEIVFCADDAAIVAAFTRHVAAALNAADAAILVVSESHRPHILQKLRTQGVGVDAAFEWGTCLSLDADVAPDPVELLGVITRVREAAVRRGKAHARIAFCGERAGSLWAAGRTEEAFQLEQLCGELPHDVDILCVYPVPYTNDNQALTRICAEHTAVSASSSIR